MCMGWGVAQLGGGKDLTARKCRWGANLNAKLLRGGAAKFECKASLSFREYVMLLMGETEKTLQNNHTII